MRDVNVLFDLYLVSTDTLQTEGRFMVSVKG